MPPLPPRFDGELVPPTAICAIAHPALEIVWLYIGMQVFAELGRPHSIDAHRGRDYAALVAASNNISVWRPPGRRPARCSLSADRFAALGLVCDHIYRGQVTGGVFRATLIGPATPPERYTLRDRARCCDDILTPAEVSRYCDVPLETVHMWCASGRLPVRPATQKQLETLVEMGRLQWAPKHGFLVTAVADVVALDQRLRRKRRSSQ